MITFAVAMYNNFQNKIAESPFELYTSTSGIRVVHQRIASPVAYCSLMMNTGTRDESENEHGAAHLVEHLIFKKTGKRKAHHILCRMENVGGEINAYTTKENTCVHSTFLNTHYGRALELFSDIVFNHEFIEKLIQLEKSVVIDEINASKDNPAEVLFDDFDKFLFPNHPLGKNTLGNVKSINRLSKADLERFVACNYHPCKMVISSVGNISFQRLIDYVEKYFGKIPPNHNNIVARNAPAAYFSFQKDVSKKNNQSHCLIGTTCDSSDREFRIAMAMLANLLGGPGMNTRLNMSLRERYGWVYHVEATYAPYSDMGVFQIYFASDKSKLEKCVLQIEKELDKLKKTPLTKEQLKKLQQQAMGQLAIASDYNDTRMLSAGKSILMFNRVEHLNEICRQIMEVSAERFCEIANKVFCNLSFLKHH